MSLKSEELLKPRYKVIADYPDSILSVGDIFETYDNGIKYVTQLSKVDVKEYPHLFKPLEWHEDRKPEDMPEYVKDIGDGEIFRVDKYELPKKIQVIRNGKSFHPDSPTHFVSIEHFHPATKEEWDNYINSKA